MIPAAKDPTATSQYVARELRKLKNNIGEARLFAGVHWIRDHQFGQRLGTAVADVIIRKMQEDCIPAVGSDPNVTVPTDAEIKAARDVRTRPCDGKHDRIPSRSERGASPVIF